MKKKTILFGSLFAAFLMLMATAVATPVKKGMNNRSAKNKIDGNFKLLKESIMNLYNKKDLNPIQDSSIWAIIAGILAFAEILILIFLFGPPGLDSSWEDVWEEILPYISY